MHRMRSKRCGDAQVPAEALRCTLAQRIRSLHAGGLLARCRAPRVNADGAVCRLTILFVGGKVQMQNRQGSCPLLQCASPALRTLTSRVFLFALLGQDRA